MKIIWVLFVLLVISNSAYADVSARIYECSINGQRVFSDHVCGSDAVQRDVTVTSRMDTVSVSPTKPTTLKRTHKSSTSVSAPTGTEKRRQQCKRIENSRDALIEKMRAGFTAKQDERLHARLHKLDGEYFELRCSGVS